MKFGFVDEHRKVWPVRMMCAVLGLSAGRVAAELGLHETVLRRWMMQFGTQATGTPRRPNTQAVAPSPSDLVADNARLRRENERLRMEHDILKKPRSSSDRPPDEVRVRR